MNLCLCQQRFTKNTTEDTTDTKDFLEVDRKQNSSCTELFVLIRAIRGRSPSQVEGYPRPNPPEGIFIFPSNFPKNLSKISFKKNLAGNAMKVQSLEPGRNSHRKNPYDLPKQVFTFDSVDTKTALRTNEKPKCPYPRRSTEIPSQYSMLNP